VEANENTAWSVTLRLANPGPRLNLFSTPGEHTDGGAVASDIGTNGNRIIGSDEEGARTVPTRATGMLPTPEVRDIVTLTNTFTSGLATTPISSDSIGVGVTLSGSLTFNVAGAGVVSNKVKFKSSGLPVTLAVEPPSPATGVVPHQLRPRWEVKQRWHDPADVEIG